MKKILYTVIALVLAVLVSLFTAPAQESPAPAENTGSHLQIAAPTQEALPAPEGMEESTEEEPYLDPEGSYTTKEDVSLYIHLYGCLPDNYITKAEARKLGWEGGGLDDYAYGMCIGGDRFGNNEKLLPEDREYIECDINTLHKTKRGAERLVFSGDGLIYYTENHYESFELLYGEP